MLSPFLIYLLLYLRYGILAARISYFDRAYCSRRFRGYTRKRAESETRNTESPDVNSSDLPIPKSLAYSGFEVWLPCQSARLKSNNNEVAI